MRIKPSYFLLLFLLSVSLETFAYPIDGYLLTGIRRLLYEQLVEIDSLKGKKNKAGALKSLEDIELYLTDYQRKDSLGTLPTIDTDLQKELDKLFPNRHSSYSLTLMDITPGKPVRYAARKENRQYQPGSVGKLAVVTALFCELENLFPNSFVERRELLKSRMIIGDQFAVYDHHTVPVYDMKTQRRVKRRVNTKDVFSLYEWIDFMMSVSNNGAASVVWREALLMREFGQEYPCYTSEYLSKYFKETERKRMAEVAQSVVNEPLRHLGIDEDEWRLGTMFTRGASGIVPPKGGSTGTPQGLMKWMMALEMGDVVDPASSLEIKRLLYMTDRRIRYASNRQLDSVAVYFKSGSLYKCDRNKDPNCKKYAGNVYNYMNSVAIIERPDSVVYLVVLMTNVLRRNSAYDHNRLAGQIDDLFPYQVANIPKPPLDSMQVIAEELREDEEENDTDNR